MATSVAREPISRPKIAHDESIDLCKGVAILLVVVGHAIQQYVARPDDNIAFRLISSFHMPLFFMLSGMVFKPDTPGRLAKTAKRLLPPVASWYLLFYLVGGSYKSLGLGPYILRFLVSPDYGLWFLWVLFFAIVLLACTKRMEVRIGIVAYPLTIMAVYAVPCNRFGLHLLKYYLPFLMLGYLMVRCRRRLRPWMGTLLLTVSIATYACVLPFWHRTAEQAQIDKAHLLNAGLRLIGFIAVRYLAGFSGSMIAICLLRSLNRIIDIRILKWIGKQSLEIYACQFLAFEIVRGQGAWALILGMVAALAISLALSNTLGRVQYINAILFGKSGRVPVRSMQAS